MVKASFYTLKMKMYQIKIYWMAWYEYMLYDRNTTCVGRGFVDLAMALLVFLYNNVYICFLGGYFYYYQKWTILSPCLTRGRKRTGGIKKYIQETVCPLAIPCQARERDNSIISTLKPTNKLKTISSFLPTSFIIQ